MGGGNLRVVASRTWEELAPIHDKLDALNRSCRRPCPQHGWSFLAAYTRNDEMPDLDQRMLFLVAYDGAEAVGYLALREYTERLFGLRGRRVGWLNWRETDRPQAVARPEDEARCCQAFFRFLLEECPGWSILELIAQDSGSGLRVEAGRSTGGCYVRTLPSLVHYTLALPWRSLGAYWEGVLSTKQRSDVARNVRKLLAAGDVEVIGSRDARARQPLFDLFLDLERRSWQAQAQVHIARRPQRVALFRALMAPEQPFETSIDYLRLDGVPVAGLISFWFAGKVFWVSLLFDRAFEKMGPGHLLILRAIGQAIDRGATEIDFGYGTGHYKTRWGAEPTETETVQVMRRGGLYHLKAMAGALRQRLRPSGPPADAKRRDVEDASPAPSPAPERGPERALAEQTLGDLEAAGIPLTRLSGAALEATLPFPREVQPHSGRKSRKGGA